MGDAQRFQGVPVAELGTIVSCPACGGRGWRVNPSLRGQDDKCTLCRGQKKILLEPCYCGRTRRVDKKGYVGANPILKKLVFSCGRDACKHALMPVVDDAVSATTNNVVRTMPTQGGGANRYNEWLQNMEGGGSE